MTFRLVIELGDAMQNKADVQHALVMVARDILSMDDSGSEKRIRDDNGNTVGRCGFYDDREATAR